MPLLSQARALEILGSTHIQAIRAAIHEAVADYYDKYPDALRAVHDSTARAVLIHNHIRDRISRYAAEHEGDLRIVYCNRMFVLVVRQQVAIRFKKLDKDLGTSNWLTGQVRAFKGQQQIDGLGALYHLEAGYQLDEMAQKAIGIFIMCPNGPNNYYWDWSVTEALVEPVATDLYEMQHAEAPAVDDDVPAIVAPRRNGNVVPLKPAKKSQE